MNESDLIDLKAACEGGDGNSCRKVGAEYYKSENLFKTEAMTWLGKGCALGNDSSCSAIRYFKAANYTGLGVVIFAVAVSMFLRRRKDKLNKT